MFESLDTERTLRSGALSAMLVEGPAKASAIIEELEKYAGEDFDRTQKIYAEEMDAESAYLKVLDSLQAETKKASDLSKILAGLAKPPDLLQHGKDLASFGQAFQTENAKQACLQIQSASDVAQANAADAKAIADALQAKADALKSSLLPDSHRPGNRGPKRGAGQGKTGRRYQRQSQGECRCRKGPTGQAPEFQSRQRQVPITKGRPCNAQIESNCFKPPWTTSTLAIPILQQGVDNGDTRPSELMEARNRHEDLQALIAEMPDDGALTELSDDDVAQLGSLERVLDASIRDNALINATLEGAAQALDAANKVHDIFA